MSDTEELLRRIMRALETGLPGNAFVLLVAPFDAPEPERTLNYIGNTERPDMVAMLREAIALIEGDQS